VSIFIQNSLTKLKEEFVPFLAGDVKMYTCGVTVYDDCHVGHARSLFIFDCIKRYLEYRGYIVKLVRNITDVDDKIINRSKEEGVSFDEVRNKYIENYYRDLEGLQIQKADFEPKATENVYYMVAHIKQLIDKGAAYEVEGDDYFSVRSFPRYGQLSGQSIDEMVNAVRIEKDERKKDPLDFALWKKSKEGEPSWKSPWGMGRPGWHIECSTMSLRYLRCETLDIHAGGRDLIFPHHENEIAQAEALTGKKFAKYWIHHGLLTIDGKKMSKSLGNFITIQDVLKQYRPNVLKMFFLCAHYGSPMDFTFEGLKKSARAYEKIEEFLDKVVPLRNRAREEEPSIPTECQMKLQKARQEFERVMDDDFNTAQALAVVFELLNLGNRSLVSETEKEAAVAVCDCLIELAGVLGLSLKAPQKVVDYFSERIKITDPTGLILDPAEIEKLLGQRRQARQNKDFKKADEIRDYLRRHGVILEDKKKAS
jgi:cysteinyl-tRNA synthetase